MDDFDVDFESGEPEIVFETPDTVAVEQDEAREARYEAAADKLKEHQAEESETKAGGNYRFLPENGPNGKKGLDGAKGKARTQQFLAASAAAYDQPITLNLGGRNVNMTLGDVRDAASDRYNHYATKVRELKAQGASSEKIKAAQQKMRDFQQLMDLTDMVARGEISPVELQRHIDDKRLGDDLLEARENELDADQVEAKAEIDKNATDLKEMSDDDLFASLALGNDIPQSGETEAQPNINASAITPFSSV